MLFYDFSNSYMTSGKDRRQNKIIKPNGNTTYSKQKSSMRRLPIKKGIG